MKYEAFVARKLQSQPTPYFKIFAGKNTIYMFHFSWLTWTFGAKNKKKKNTT